MWQLIKMYKWEHFNRYIYLSILLVFTISHFIIFQQKTSLELFYIRIKITELTRILYIICTCI